MEFVDKYNLFNKVTISDDLSIVTINGNSFKITHIDVFTEDLGKFHTEEHVIKFSKGTLFVLHKNKPMGAFKYSSGSIKFVTPAVTPIKRKFSQI
jgi:hypothetical protein